jgi:hypothetical protein
MNKYVVCFLIVIFETILNLLPIQGQNLNFIQYSNEGVENTDLYKKGNVYQKDLLLFIDVLKECHPAFSPRHTFPFDIDSISSVGYNWAVQCKNVGMLKSYLQTISALLNDGHTTLLPDYDENLVYPFLFFIDNDKMYLRGVNKEYEASIGKQINQINGRPIFEVLNSFRKIISSDNEIRFLYNVNNSMSSYTMWKNNPFCLPDSSLSLTFTDNTNISLYPIPVNQISWALQQPKDQINSIRENTKQSYLYKLLPEQGICYLQFNACYDQNPRFDTFLKEMFQTIESQKIKNLVIDVRNNGGGNSLLCDVLLSWLKPVKEIKNGTSSIRFSNLWKQHYPTLAAEYEQIFIENKLSFEMGKLYGNPFLSNLSGKKEEASVYEKTIDEYFIKKEDGNKIFQGNVFFIQSEKTYSSAGQLIAKATDNNIGIVVGSKSSYRPCRYGDALAWKLPNTKIRGIVSHKIFNRPNSDKCNEMSLTPTIYMPLSWADILSGEDICWNWILEYCKSH